MDVRSYGAKEGTSNAGLTHRTNSKAWICREMAVGSVVGADSLVYN